MTVGNGCGESGKQVQKEKFLVERSLVWSPHIGVTLSASFGASSNSCVHQSSAQADAHRSRQLRTWRNFAGSSSDNRLGCRKSRRGNHWRIERYLLSSFPLMVSKRDVAFSFLLLFRLSSSVWLLSLIVRGVWFVVHRSRRFFRSGNNATCNGQKLCRLQRFSCNYSSITIVRSMTCATAVPNSLHICVAWTGPAQNACMVDFAIHSAMSRDLSGQRGRWIYYKYKMFPRIACVMGYTHLNQ